MGRALDMFRTKLLQLHETPRLFLSDMFMMMLFTELEYDLPTFKEYWQQLCCKRKMRYSSGGALVGAYIIKESSIGPHE